MKKMINLLFLAVSLMAASPAWAQFSIYVSPTGSDSNDCLTAATACQSPNVAIGRIAKQVNTQVNVYFDQGKIYAPAYAPDGGAPTAADAMGTVSLQGYSYSAGGSLNLICATQPISVSAGSVSDAGTISGSFAQAWLQVVSPDGGWGGYAVDAGYAYVDGGLIANSLKGQFVQAASGSESGVSFPIVANDLTTVTYVSGSNSAAVTPPSTVTFYSPSTHIYPYPIDGGVSTSYSEATLYVAGNSAESNNGDLFLSGANPVAMPPGKINVYYCDLATSPGGSKTLQFATVESRDVSLLLLQGGSITADEPTFGDDLTTLGGTVAIKGEVINAGFNLVYEFSNSPVYLVGDYVTQAATTTGSQIIITDHSQMGLNGSVINLPAIASSGVIGSVKQQSTLNATFDDINYNTGSSSIPFLAGSGSFLSLNDVALGADGGNGVAALTQSSGVFFNSSNTYTLSNLVSLDNGISWITATTFGTTDGGAAGYHAVCNNQWGNCASNKL